MINVVDGFQPRAEEALPEKDVARSFRNSFATSFSRPECDLCLLDVVVHQSQSEYSVKSFLRHSR